MTDIVKRLRLYAKQEPDDPDTYREAADEIERLRAALEESQKDVSAMSQAFDRIQEFVNQGVYRG